VLRDLGVQTFADLRLAADGDGQPEHRWSLVVTASDVSRRRLVRLPWDYASYGLEPDEQRVADAVRASSAIPFYYEPMTLRSPDKTVSTLVDGSVLSSFPVEMFDRTNGLAPRWPTFGVRLSARPGGRLPVQQVTGPVSLALALVESMIEACDARHIDDRCVQARSVFVDTSGFSPVDFTIDPDQQQALVAAGRAAATQFLSRWSWESYLAECREARP
jgi:NTE family protein